MSAEELKALANDPDFAKLLEDSDKAYQEAESFFRYEPDSGQHDCLITEIKVGKIEDKKAEKVVLQVRVMVEITNGDEAGESFDLSGQFGWTPRNFVGLKTLASLLTGKTDNGGIMECLGTLYEHRGTGIQVTTSRTPRKDGEGDPWVNHRPQHIIDIGVDPTEPTLTTEG